MKFLQCFVLFLGVSVITKGDVGVAPGSIPVEAVFNQATLVCSCIVESVDDRQYRTETAGKPSMRHEVTAMIAIQDAYKTDDPRVKEVSVHYSLEEQQGHSLSGSRFGLLKNETVLLFLTKTGNDIYEFANPFIGATQFSSLPNQSGGEGLLRLQHVLVGVVQKSGRTDQLKALQILQGINHISNDTLSVVTPLAQSADPDIALTAFGILLRTKSPESVQNLQRYLESFKSNAQPVALFVIGPELGEITNIKALPALEALSASRFLSIQFGAMDAIRHIRHVDSVPTLIERLDDANPTVRYIAVIALAEIYGKFEGDYAPSMYLFDKKPQYYTGLWKSWWVERGGKP